MARWGLNTLARAYLDMLRLVPSLWIRPQRYEQTLGELVDAVAAHDPARARDILSRHLARVDEVIGQTGTDGEDPSRAGRARREPSRKPGPRGGHRRGAQK